jgi:hypothetical protein
MHHISSIFCSYLLPLERSHLQQMRIRNILISFVAVFLYMGCLTSALAGSAGRFEIVNADFRVDDGVWFADARTDLQLSDDALKALESGVTLTIQYQFTVNRKRAMWPDKMVAEQVQNIELQYLSLSRRYVVRNLGADELASYATLFSALRQIGYLRDFPVVSNAKIDPDKEYYFSMRVVLSREKLPGPLQVLIFWRGDFSLESEWYRWTLK